MLFIWNFAIKKFRVRARNTGVSGMYFAVGISRRKPRGFGRPGRGSYEVQGKETKKGTKQSYEKVPKGYAVAPKKYDSCEALEHLVSSISQKKAEQEHIKFVYV